jgi:hypothetical protein
MARAVLEQKYYLLYHPEFRIVEELMGRERDYIDGWNCRTGANNARTLENQTEAQNPENQTCKLECHGSNQRVSNRKPRRDNSHF